MCHVVLVLDVADGGTADQLVDDALLIRASYSKCTDKKTEEQIAMKHHTMSRRSFEQGTFCVTADVRNWKETLNFERGAMSSGSRFCGSTVAQQQAFLSAYSRHKEVSGVPATSPRGHEQRQAIRDLLAGISCVT
jgi:hypothetical protein